MTRYTDPSLVTMDDMSYLILISFTNRKETKQQPGCDRRRDTGSAQYSCERSYRIISRGSIIATEAGVVQWQNVSFVEAYFCHPLQNLHLAHKATIINHLSGISCLSSFEQILHFWPRLIDVDSKFG